MEALVQLAQIPIGSYAAWSAVILVAVSGLIQIAPIKVNPWSTVARRFGQAINHDLLSKIDGLEKDVAELRKVGDAREAKEDERNAKAYRMRILRFGDEIRHGQLHSAEHYNDVLQDITEYEAYCVSHPGFKNQKAQSTIKLIAKAYEEHMRKNDFLE
mgnify:FL=1